MTSPLPRTMPASIRGKTEESLPQHGYEVLGGGTRRVNKGVLAISPVKMLYQPIPFIWVLLVKQQSRNRVEYIRELY